MNENHLNGSGMIPPLAPLASSLNGVSNGVSVTKSVSAIEDAIKRDMVNTHMDASLDVTLKAYRWPREQQQQQQRPGTAPMSQQPCSLPLPSSSMHSPPAPPPKILPVENVSHANTGWMMAFGLFMLLGAVLVLIRANAHLDAEARKTSLGVDAAKANASTSMMEESFIDDSVSLIRDTLQDGRWRFSVDLSLEHRRQQLINATMTEVKIYVGCNGDERATLKRVLWKHGKGNTKLGNLFLSSVNRPVSDRVIDTSIDMFANQFILWAMCDDPKELMLIASFDTINPSCAFYHVFFSHM
jgi:hypothetical protein